MAVLVLQRSDLMSDDSVVLDATMRITKFSGAVHELHYSVDLRDPDLERFNMTDTERQRVLVLFDQALEAGGAEDGEEPFKTLTEIAFEIIARAVERDHSKQRSQR